MSNNQNISSQFGLPLVGSLRSSTIGTIIGLIVLAVCVFTLNLMGVFNVADASNESDVEEIRRLPVLIEPARYVENIDQNRKYTGIIRAKQQADLGFELTGRVDSVSVDEGDVVVKDQILATLDVKALTARKNAMEASLAQAKAVLDELVAGPRSEKIESMKAQREEAESNLKLAKINLDRREKLRGRAISKEEYDRALYNYQAALARSNSTQKQLDELVSGTRPEKIAAQQAAYKQLNSSVQEIVIQIEKSSIVAPFNGKIVKRMIDPGGIANASTPVLKIVDTENLEAVIGIPIDTAQSLNVNDSYSVTVNEQPFTAQLVAKIQQLETTTRTQNLIFQLNEYANTKVLPGQLGQIEISTQVQAKGFWVPATSLSNGIRGLWSIFTVDPESSRVARADVQIVYTDGNRALVSGPIEDGNQVIVDGTHRIVEGQYVQAITE